LARIAATVLGNPISSFWKIFISFNCFSFIKNKSF
jgi:hypothetical protein